MAGAFVLLAGAVLAVAAMRARDSLTEYRIQLFAVVAAAVFATQMLNWPIPGGTSAHFAGGAFAAIVLGPHLGAFAVALVVAVQALVFGDGGALALGANQHSQIATNCWQSWLAGGSGSPLLQHLLGSTSDSHRASSVSS
ncbi:energy-coupling factor ABC transporter permease [Salinigranum halophilum]|uniref:energy-coupling factor ABC transporter permease n=1 Tax=Salinigranum halophilum TaxID=2565931 RepID=UPI0022AA0675|nr:energy-coupling factor ABC transporter permease [Salinigranum halophilum]